jgi:NADH:ubiquinone oxidoreductase subunit E
MVSPSRPTEPALPMEAPGAVGADALIEVLHRLQEHQGWLDHEALRQVAHQLRLPLSHVYGVASFYHLFRLRQPTPHRCEVCLGSACFVRGAMQLAAQLARQLGVVLDDPLGDGTWSLARVGCLGACGQAPVLVVDDVLLTRLPLDPASLPALEQRLQQAGLPDGGTP